MFRYELVQAADDEHGNEVAGEVLARAVDVDGWLADPVLPERRQLVLRGCPVQTPVGDLQLQVWDGDDPEQYWDLVDPVVHAQLPEGDLVLSAAVCLRDDGPRSKLTVKQPRYRLTQHGRFAGSCRTVDGLPLERQCRTR